MLWANPLSRPNIVDNGGGKMRTHQELRAVKLFYALHIAYIYIQAREQLYTCPGMVSNTHYLAYLIYQLHCTIPPTILPTVADQKSMVLSIQSRQQQQQLLMKIVEHRDYLSINSP